MSFINTKEFKEYTSYNKSLFFLLPLLSSEKETHKTHLWKPNIFNTYLRYPGYEHLERPLFIHYMYEDTEEFKLLEDYFETNLNDNTFVDRIDVDEKSIIIVYNITNEIPYPDNSTKEPHDSCVTDYDIILEGKYSKISTRHKLRILNFFYDKGCGYDNFLRLLFGRNEILWEMRKKNLGCRQGDGCMCVVATKLVETLGEGGQKTMIPKIADRQNYHSCKNFSDWKMPYNVELEEKINLEEETYGQNILSRVKTI